MKEHELVTVKASTVPRRPCSAGHQAGTSYWVTLYGTGLYCSGKYPLGLLPKLELLVQQPPQPVTHRL